MVSWKTKITKNFLKMLECWNKYKNPLDDLACSKKSWVTRYIINVRTPGRKKKPTLLNTCTYKNVTFANNSTHLSPASHPPFLFSVKTHLSLPQMVMLLFY